MTHTNDAQTLHTCQTQSGCKPRLPSYIRGPAYIQGPASIRTITSDPWLVFEEIRYRLILVYREIFCTDTLCKQY